MTSEDTINNCNSKMKKAFDVFNHDLGSLRTGRANASMLDIIKVDVYGQKMPVNQLATISTPEPRLLTVQVWDQNNVTLDRCCNQEIQPRYKSSNRWSINENSNSKSQ